MGRAFQLLYLRLRNRIYQIREHEHSRYSRYGLLQQFETLSSKPGRNLRQPGDIPARLSEAFDEPSCHRVAECEQDDRNRASYALRGLSSWGGRYDDDVGL